MKKRLLSALLALALVFVLLPTTALASSIDPDITIAGTEYDFELENYKENTYKTVYYQHDKFLTKFEYTSDGVWATDPYLELTKTGAGNATTITITVHKGSNTTKAFEIKSAETCIATSSSYWNLVITGSGALSLTHTGTSAAIWSNHSNITITGGVTVNVKGTKSGSNINSYSNAIQCGETFTVSNGATVVAENNSTYSNGPAVKTEKFIISGDAKFEAKSAYGGKAISFDSITADGYDFMGRSGNSGSYTTLTGDDKATKLQEYSSIKITPTPTPALEKSNVYVAGTNLYKNTAYTIQNGKPVMGGTYPGNYNIYFDATDYVLHVKDAVIEATGNARGTTGIYGTSNIVFEGDNSITASTYGIYSYFTSSDLKISGTGSLTVKTKASCPAIATVTNYTPKPSIEISGQGFTVTADTSGTTSPAITSAKDLTVKDGVTVKAASNATRAIDIDGDLTVTNGSLTATSKSDNVPTVQVGGNATFTGSTVTITNNSTTQGEQYKDSNAASSALHVNGAVTISGGTVMAEAKAGGNAIRAVGNITVSNDATVTAKNNSQYFNAITAGRATGGEVNTLYNLIVSGENTRITATNTHDNNLTYGGAINAYIKNANEGHYLQVGTDTKAIAPNVNTTVRNNSLTITRGDKVTRTNSPVVIDGTTLLNDTYYTITNGSPVADGSKNNYNAFYDSASKTLKLNNAKISTTTNNAAIKIGEDAFATYTITVTGTNELQGNYNHCIESYSSFKINGDGTLEMTNGSNTTASVIYCGPDKSLTIGAEVIFKNNSNSGVLLGMVEKDAYSFAEGYNVYASTNVSGSPLEAYDAAKGSTYKYLRVTKENLAPTTPTPQTPFTIYGIPAQFVDGGMIATTGVTATSSNNINLPIDRVEWYTFTPGFRPDGSMDSVINKTKATGNFEAGKYYVVEIRFVQDLSPFESWDMKVSGWSDNDVSRQSVTARNDIEIYFLTPASAATHEHNWAENYDPVYHWKMCTYDGCTAIKDKALHVWNAWHTSNNEQQHSKSCSECSYSTPPHNIDLAYVSDGEQGHHLYCKHDGCTFVTGTTAHNYEEGKNICRDCGYDKSAPCDHTGDRAYTNNGDGTHKVTCKACGATIVEKQNHEFNPTGVCIYCGATQSGGDPTPDNPGTIVIIRPAEEEKPAQQPNPSTGANDLVGLAVAAAVAAALGSAALLRKHD